MTSASGTRRAKVLIVEDDPNISEIVRLYLEKDGYLVEQAENGSRALNLFDEEPPDLVVLDVMLPGMDGWEVCRSVRQRGRIPVIMLTAKGETFDKVLGLELGADDYIVKPFDPRELMARVKAVLRRSASGSSERGGPSGINANISYPGLAINAADYCVKVLGNDIKMPPKEVELLAHLARNPQRVFRREELLEAVWGYDYYGDTRTIDVHIKRIREKLEPAGGPWRIETVWGVGYKFAVD